ncbi:MAG: hypothetical protein MK052_12550 [Alphaproteobacteria bacterium]|nr:hypothetical protein [Alphaproteobacteria bacterium]
MLAAVFIGKGATMWRVLGLVFMGVLLADLALAKDENASKEESLSIGGRTNWYCTWRDVSLEEWVNKRTGIFSGKAIKVASKHPNFEQKNECWAYFDVKEWLKPKGPNEIWVHVIISEYNKSYEDFSSLKYCPFKKGENYAVFGSFYEPTKVKSFPSVTIATNLGGNSSYHCGPTTSLNSSFSNNEFDKARAYIEKDIK